MQGAPFRGRSSRFPGVEGPEGASFGGLPGTRFLAWTMHILPPS